MSPTIEKFLKAVNPGGVKAAAANTEPDSQGGATTHPSKNVEDGTQAAETGARAAENTKQVKEEIGPPSVDAAPEAKAKTASSVADLVSKFSKPTKAAAGAAADVGSAADDQIQIGTNKQPTGKDPSTETDSAKAGKKDVPTTHPASTENESLGGGKYAADSLEKIASELTAIGEQLCTDITNLVPSLKQASEQPKVASTSTAQPKVASVEIDPALAQQLGWEMAGLVTGKFDKAAADSLVHGTLKSVIFEAAKQADDLADALDGYRVQLAKQAEGEGPPELEGAPAGDPGGAPPMPPEVAAGGLPPGGEGGEGGGGGGAGQDELLAILEQLGISPEELIQALQAQGAGAGGPGAGGAPADPMAGAMAGGPPPMPPGGAPPGGGPPPMEAKAAEAPCATCKKLPCTCKAAADGVPPAPAPTAPFVPAAVGSKKKKGDQKSAAAAFLSELTKRSNQRKAAAAAR